MEPAKLLAFVGAFAVVALSPGMCMTLSMSLGISIGVRRTLWMMAGELLGITLVGAAAVLGVAVVLLQSPAVFSIFKWLGAAYLFYSAWQTWRSDAVDPDSLGDPGRHRSRSGLVALGFLTAVGNPKAWVFLVALLPPFVDRDQPLPPQLLTLLLLMITIEFSSLLAYAWGGRRLGTWLHRRGRARLLNQMSAGMMLAVGAWLASS